MLIWDVAKTCTQWHAAKQRNNDVWATKSSQTKQICSGTLLHERVIYNGARFAMFGQHLLCPYNCAPFDLGKICKHMTPAVFDKRKCVAWLRGQIGDTCVLWCTAVHQRTNHPFSNQELQLARTHLILGNKIFQG
jgi:hypothetical protein